MAELHCRVKNCVYFKDNLCCKGDIMVGGKHATESRETSCESFIERKGNSYTSAMDHPCKTISIDCEAEKCSYNSNYKCHASQVEITCCDGTTCSGDTVCETFKQK